MVGRGEVGGSTGVKNIQSQYSDLKVHLLSFAIFHETWSFSQPRWYLDLKESSREVMERDEALIFSCRACLFFIVFWWPKKNITFKFLFTFNPWILNSFDLPSYGSELRKRNTVRLLLMCLEKKRFGSCSAWGNGWQMTHLGERCVLGGLRVRANYEN